MINIFILTEGGGSIGMGHISRCLSLYQAFAEYGYPSLLIVSGKETIFNALAGINYVHLDWINKEEEVLSMLCDSDILIIDSYLCPVSLYQKLAFMSSITAYIDDDIRVDYPKGVIINGIMCAEKMDYPTKKEISYLLGQEYSFLRKEFWEVPDKIIKNQISSVAITCGGNDENDLSYRILRSLVEEYPELEKKIILKSLETPYIEYCRNHSTVLTNLSALEMRTVLIDSDIVITASGQTTYELCRIGTPFIAIITAQNQTFSITCFHKNGLVGVPISSDDEEMNRKILNQFSNLVDYYLRKTIHKKMKQAITGKGPLKIVEYLLTTLDKK